MGFETFKVDNSEVIINALRIGYRHLDLAKNNKKSKNKGGKVGSIFTVSQVSETTTKVL